MTRSGRARSGSYLNPDFLACRAIGACCRGCARRDDCPLFEIDRSLLRM
jgi:hypothetical protein